MLQFFDLVSESVSSLQIVMQIRTVAHAHLRAYRVVQVPSVAELQAFPANWMYNRRHDNDAAFALMRTVEAWQAHRSLLIYCKRGRNRSASMVVALYSLLAGVSAEEARCISLLSATPSKTIMCVYPYISRKSGQKFCELSISSHIHPQVMSRS